MVLSQQKQGLADPRHPASWAVAGGAECPFQDFFACFCQIVHSSRDQVIQQMWRKMGCDVIGEMVACAASNGEHKGGELTQAQGLLGASEK